MLVKKRKKRKKKIRKRKARSEERRGKLYCICICMNEHEAASASFLSSIYYYSDSDSDSEPLFSLILLRFSSTSPPPQSPLLRYPLRSEMEGTVSTGMYPLHRTKTIHLVRHAQGIHNVAGEKDYNAYLSEELFDAQLTPLGWNQVDNLRKHVKRCGLDKKIELVITSPLLRTMQTAVGVFGGEGYSDGVKAAPLMIDNAFNTGRPPISSQNAPPFLASELCREHLGEHPCDRRRSIGEYRPVFPAIDFSLIENDDDVLWTPDVREKNEELAARGAQFISWLWTRKEKEIAIVSHSGFLFHTLSSFGKDCHPSVQEEITGKFANCELRSMVLVDRSMIGTEGSTYNYPGKIPSGQDKPSGDLAP